MPEFDVLEPTRLQEAVEMLDRLGDRACPLAGGTDLLVALKGGRAHFDYLVNLKRIAGLDVIEPVDGQGVQIGALAKVAQVAASPVVREHFPILAQAAGLLGSLQVRNLASVGGNLCHAAPSAELAPALIALGATVQLCGPGGTRELPLESFFSGPGRTVLGKGELLSGLWLPFCPPHTGGHYVKYAPRRMMDIALVSVAVLLTADARRERCSEARVVLGAVAPTPLRVQAAEDVLRGQVPDAGRVDAAAHAAAAAARPIDDVRASAAYRRDVLQTLVGRAVQEAWRSIEQPET